MVTRSQVGIYKPNPKYALMVVGQEIPQIPKYAIAARRHDGWRSSIQEEMDAFHYNHTWQLVPRDTNMHVIGSKMGS